MAGKKCEVAAECGNVVLKVVQFEADYDTRDDGVDAM